MKNLISAVVLSSMLTGCASDGSGPGAGEIVGGVVAVLAVVAAAAAGAGTQQSYQPTQSFNDSSSDDQILHELQCIRSREANGFVVGDGCGQP